MKDLISKNLMELNGKIAEACELYDRDADDISIVAVTKTHPASIINISVAAGLHEIGESRIQEAEPKINEIGHIARFHMVGHLQTNKVKKAVELFDVIQSVDSMKLADEINLRTAAIDKTIECYIEVNCSGESQKFGVQPQECIDLIKKINALSNIELTGLMTIGPYTDDENEIRAAFGKCHQLFKAGQDIVGNSFDTLSMGMSGDFSYAIAEGSTMIRIGSSLFGARNPI